MGRNMGLESEGKFGGGELTDQEIEFYLADGNKYLLSEPDLEVN
jgi:hypothetical protein